MGELIWFFPKTVEEVKDIITSREGVVPHGGGTGLLRGDIKRYRGLLDLGKLGLSYITEHNGFVEIGAMTTYGDVVRYFKKKDSKSVLYRSLVDSATTPLKNRITVGGSIAYFPPWSDIMGSLFTLSAEVFLTGEREGWFKILDYVSNRGLYRKTVILKIRYNKDKDTGYSAHYRAVRTRVDHPAFTITLLVDIKDKRVDDASIYVVGTKDKFKKLTSVEKEIIGKKASEIDTEALNVDNVEFYGRPQFTLEYQKALFEIEVKRKLREVLESVK